MECEITHINVTSDNRRHSFPDEQRRLFYVDIWAD